MKEKKFVRPTKTVTYWVNENVSAPVVFFLHGAAMDHKMFEDQYAALRSDYTIIAWDTPRFIDKEEYSLTTLAHDALALLDKIGVTSVTLVGQSHGSLIAQMIYKIRPQFVDGLVSIGGTPIMIPYSPLEVWLLRRISFIIKYWPYKQLLRFIAAKTASTQQVQKYSYASLSNYSRQEIVRIWMSITSALTKTGIENLHIRVPLLVAYGEHDHTGQIQRNNHRWKLYEPKAELVVIRGAGHNANQDNPTEFNQLLRAFLSAVYVGR